MPDALAAYAKIARRYAGDAADEDDPAWRAANRALFRSRLSGPTVLEVGCGPATDSAKLAEAGLRVTASDGCPAFLEVVRERYPHLPTRLFDFTRPPPFPDRFDGVYGVACFIHLPPEQAPAALRHLRTVLRPGGLLFLSLIRSTQVDGYTIDDWGGEPENPVRFTCHEPSAITQLLHDAGFRDVECGRTPSVIYDDLPRLRERGVRTYHVLARARSDPDMP